MVECTSSTGSAGTAAAGKTTYTSIHARRLLTLAVYRVAVPTRPPAIFVAPTYIVSAPHGTV